MGARRAILYARISSDDRVNEGRNLQGQLDLCRSHALDKGWSVIAEFAEDDRGASGAKLDLPKLNEILDLARRGEFDVLVVREIDRLARSLPKQLYVEEILSSEGVDIQYVLGAFADSDEGRFMKNVRAAVAELERLKTRERSERGKLQAVKSGSILVNDRPPYGYEVIRINGKFTLRIREDEASIVRLVFDWYTKGDEHGKEISLKKIAHRLTEMCIPTYVTVRKLNFIRAAYPGRWHKSTVQRMLASTVYKGEWRYRKNRVIDGQRRRGTAYEQVRVEVPAIVDEVAWKIAHDKLEGNLLKTQQNPNYGYLLTGYIWCGQCNTRAYGMHPTSGNCTYYVCNVRYDPEYYARTCRCPYFRGEPLEEGVWDWIVLLMTNPETMRQSLLTQQARSNEQTAPRRAQLVLVQQEIRVHEAQQERLLDLYLGSNLSKERWEKRNGALQTKLRQLTHEQVRLQAEIEKEAPTAQRYQAVEVHGRQIWEQIQVEEETFELKRQLFKMLNLQVRLCVDPSGKRYAQVICIFGETMIDLPDRYQFRRKRRKG